MRHFVFILILGTLISCDSPTKLTENPPPKLEYTFSSLENQSHPRIRGVWRSIGNGYLLEVKADSILLYSYTKSFYYKEKNDYLEGLLNSESQFWLRGDTLGVYLTNYGDETQHLQTKKDFLRIQGMPQGCLSFSEMVMLDNKSLFTLYHETMEENYAFSRERQLNWDLLFETYQDSISSNEDALFESMGKIASLTKDQHTKVISKEGISRQYRITPSALDVQYAFEQQDEIKDLNEYFGLFFTTSKTHISDSLLKGKSQKILNDNIEWGKINDKVGYINLYSFAGFLSRDYTRAQQIDSIKSRMNQIIDTMRSVEAIIIDVSFNFGGFDAAALTIASYFTEDPIYAFSSQVYNNGVFYTEDKVMVYPAERTFTKPVYVLMTDISRSAAESFVMMMDALPQVTLLGTHTLGTLSGMLGKSVGEMYTTYSNQRLINAHGEYFEVEGVEPDIEIKVFPKENVMKGHLHAVKEIITLIENI